MEVRGMEGRFRLVNIKQAAEYLGLSKGTVYNMVAAGTFPIPVRRIGRCVKFDMKDLDTYIEQSVQKKKTEKPRN
jgi:excisionase family DNA binding protein